MRLIAVHIIVSNDSETAVHLLAAAMLVIAFFGVIIQILHRYDRRDLRLLHRPGTLASAAAITASTPMAQLLDGRQYGADMNAALQGKKFRINTSTMKVVMEGEPEYYSETARSPGWRRSAFVTGWNNRFGAGGEEAVLAAAGDGGTGARRGKSVLGRFKREQKGLGETAP